MLNACPNDLYMHVLCNMQGFGTFSIHGTIHAHNIHACYVHVGVYSVMCMSLACCIHVYNVHSTINSICATFV